MRPTFQTYEEVKCFALNKLQTTGKHTVCSEEKKDIFSEEYTVRCTGEHSPPSAKLTLLLLHIILYFVVDALCIQSILVNKLHCRS